MPGVQDTQQSWYIYLYCCHLVVVVVVVVVVR